MRLTKNCIIQATSNIADKEGLSKVSLKRIAEELGIRPPSLYNHISSIDDLLREVAHNGMKKMNSQMKDSAIGKSGNESIKSISIAYLHYSISHPGIYETIQWAVWHGNQETAEIFNDYKEFLKKLIISCNLKIVNIDEVLNLVMGILHGYTTIQLGEAMRNPDKITADFINTIDIVLLGIQQKYQ